MRIYRYKTGHEQQWTLATIQTDRDMTLDEARNAIIKRLKGMYSQPITNWVAFEYLGSPIVQTHFPSNSKTE